MATDPLTRGSKVAKPEVIVKLGSPGGAVSIARAFISVASNARSALHCEFQTAAQHLQEVLS